MRSGLTQGLVESALGAIIVGWTRSGWTSMSEEAGIFRHIVLFKWVEGMDEERIAALTAALGELREAVPEIKEYRYGLDAGINPGNADFAVVADFDSADDYLVYRDHPAHQKFRDEHIAPNVASRMAAQYEL